MGQARRSVGPSVVPGPFGTAGDQLWYVAHPVHPTDEEFAARRAREDEALAYHASLILMVGSPGLVLGRKSDFELRLAIVRDNVANARTWFTWLVRRFPEVTFIMPWVVALDGDGAADDLDPAARARGLRDCRRVVRVCDGMVHVGGRVSAGMSKEADHARVVVDLTHLGRTPPARDNRGGAQ